VSYSAADGEHGLHPLGTAALVTLDGGPARAVSQSPCLSFSVDPSFLACDTVELRGPEIGTRCALRVLYTSQQRFGDDC